MRVSFHSPIGFSVPPLRASTALLVAARVSGYYRWTPGFIDDVGFNGKDTNNGKDWGARVTLLWKPTNDLSINLNALRQQARQNGFTTSQCADGSNGTTRCSPLPPVVRQNDVRPMRWS